MRERRRIIVKGIVQGVGFRPFIYGLAQQHGLVGSAFNDTTGVTIEVEGEAASVEAFWQAVQHKPPPLALIEHAGWELIPLNGDTAFAIVPSHSESEKEVFISPDVCICDDCLGELFDPANRRYRYPFINCTNCGPRFTIIRDVPYDRPQTTMAAFAMCPDCQREYNDPFDRRFHAQPNACPRCGPRVFLRRRKPGDSAPLTGDAAIREAQRLLVEGAIVAVRGLGGYHLACDAMNDEAITRLRARKHRADKPLALMAADLATIERLCRVSEDERITLISRQRPIVLLRRREPSSLAVAVAPGQRYLGLMLPYTPLHYLLFAAADPGPQTTDISFDADDLRPGSEWDRRSQGGPRTQRAESGPTQASHSAACPATPRGGSVEWVSGPPSVLVMTSGNLSDEPIAYREDDAFHRLGGIADAFLTHNRDITIPCDDSVVRCLPPFGLDPSRAKPSNPPAFQSSNFFIRRSRGYAPQPIIIMPFEFPQPVLAVGAHLKNTFCLAKGRHAFVSHHIGDLENLETLTSFVQGIEHFQHLFDVQPAIIAHDLHPEYLSTQWAQSNFGLPILDFGLKQSQIQNLKSKIKLVPVQHHHAHIASVLAEHGLEGPVLGVAFDGTGYGPDGSMWGGEFLVADMANFTRAAHLAPVPLPGGEAAIRQPWRMAAAQLYQLYGDRLLDLDIPFITRLDRVKWAVLRQMIERNLNSPLTSSMGRLFDAVAALIGRRGEVNYEGQAAIELEMLAEERCGESYRFEISEGQPHLIDTRPLIAAVVEDLQRSVSPATISARFHNAVARLVAEGCVQLRAETGLNGVVLSGGVFQNILLLQRALHQLQTNGFQVYINAKVPPNDGGISLGQAAVAAAKFCYAPANAQGENHVSRYSW